MLTDESLRSASEEVQRFLMEAVPEDGKGHVFSNRFERKMEKLTRRASHPIRYQVLRAAAAVLIVIATVFGPVLAGSANARSVMIGWVKETLGIYDVYSNLDSIASQQDPYYLNAIPDGYREEKAIDRISGKTHVYTNSAGDVLQFSYVYNLDSNSLYIKAENYKQHTTFVNGVQADVYLALDKTQSSIIVWQDPQTDALLYVVAVADTVELIEFAEAATRAEK